MKSEPLKSDQMTQYHREWNAVMADNDDFFQQFGALDDKVYEEGAIDKKHKELMGLAISVTTKCNECILYHLKGCLKAGANKSAIIEAIKIGVIAGGSITYPNARFAFEMLQELEVIQAG
ncbi:carboxymuconolactone decarboxylase family protein [Brevibacillus humidisoli]|uniref:carboxymuconolactone decarboxylase family protein n=1 Tax=Brevibacillus humidisoli TaxID=2895522 RepID=UPI001E3965BF|nr:carboxymuconolactone decarboxylase family protein [Brevibacillus humidisoli]UFJ40238.1 carboxymuconolactone decarboxylase family protein [Brevibacillus humidisoli]